MKRTVAVVGLCAGLAGMARAGALDDIPNAKAVVGADLKKIADWAAPEFAKGFGFAAAQGSNLPVPGLSLRSAPRFELGALAGASLTPMDTAGFRALALGALDTSKIDIPGNLPLPMGVVHAKLGAVMGIDGGFRYLKTPKIDVTAGGGSVSAEQTQWGIALRKTFFGGALPFVTAGLTYDSLVSKVNYTLKQKSTTTGTYSGVSYTQTDDASLTFGLDSDVNIVGLHALAGKSLGPILPTLGASLNLPGGKSDVTLTASDAITLTQAGNAVNTATQAVSVSATGSGKPKTDFRVQAGLEFNLVIVRLGVLGEYGLSSKAAGASAGLRFQF